MFQHLQPHELLQEMDRALSSNLSFSCHESFFYLVQAKMVKKHNVIIGKSQQAIFPRDEKSVSGNIRNTSSG